MAAEDLLSSQPLVLDNGSGTLKAGFAGSERPKLCISTSVGRPKHVRAMAGAAEGETFVGENATKLRGLLRLRYPMAHGVVEDWDDMCEIWSHAYQQLQVVQEEHAVLLSEAPLNPRSNKAKAAEVFFEHYHVPALYIAPQAILSLYASGRTTGIVLDSGDGVTHCVPVYEGFALTHAITRMDVAGRDVTDYLQLLLRKSGCSMHTSAEKEIVRDIKEKKCFVASSIDRSEREDVESVEATSYTLPDGSSIKIGVEKFRAPEILFNPILIGQEYEGVHRCLVNSINRSDMDLRRTLYANVLLSGGSTLFAGFGDRLLSEVRNLAPKSSKIRIYAPKDRIHSTWVGGSILASLATFKKMWITRREYDEMGSSIVFRKSFS